MKKRDLYLKQLIKFKDKPLIKVITGIRRCGKSTLLSLFENHLKTSDIEADQIIRMNFESFKFDELTNYKELHKYIDSQLIDKNKKHYLLLDEVQHVKAWEKVINAFLVDANVD